MLSNVFKLIYINNSAPPLNHIFYIILICSLKINIFLLQLFVIELGLNLKKFKFIQS